jgi:rifampicin phosphotransferase
VPNVTAPQPHFILGLDAPGLDLAVAGGKGMGLARLIAAGHAVPEGFIVSSAAYAAFLRDNRLGREIERILSAARLDDPSDLERCAAEVHLLFSGGGLPGGLADGLLREFRALGSPPVAVRSSATAEDLPESSFAGQQETYLNVRSEPALERAVRDCWASLWTARAIGYRERQGIGQHGLALAVVVQRMVESEVSGVMFTANPVTGLRSEVVIDAAPGLGEALVSGLVEPDHFAVDARSGEITSRSIGAKSLSIRCRAEGGVERRSGPADPRQVLPDAKVTELAALGKGVEEDMGTPQDIEWALAGGRLFLLQSRPITSLFPVPAAPPDGRLHAYVSFAAVQGLPDPITPLGRDFLYQLFASGAALFGLRRTPQTQRALAEAGERLWVDITPIIASTTGRALARGAMRLAEPSVGQALDAVLGEPALAPAVQGLGARGVLRLRGFLPRLARAVIANLIAPRARRRAILARGERALERVRRRAASVSGDRWTRLHARASLLSSVAAPRLPRLIVHFISGVSAGMVPFAILNRLVTRGAARAASSRAEAPAPNPSTGWADRVLEISRGVPGNPTTEMDLLLWACAKEIRRDPESLAAFRGGTPRDLSALFAARTLPGPAQGVLDRFMAVYGDRGLAELDLGRPRWREDPEQVLSFLSNYLLIEDPDQAPDEVFRRAARAARAAAEGLAVEVGGLKAAAARWLAGRARVLLGMREAPKFFMVRLIAELRRAILESGAELAAAGDLAAADDLLYLSFAEIRALARRESRDWRALIAARRASLEREKARRQIPRMLLGDGRCYTEGLRGDGEEGVIRGAPVSPGTVEGAVRVVLSPRGAEILPGEILVCPGTDPSWTPLFLGAGGLVMEVGGMMTHGAVVAREYGIPAVVGVHEACTRLVTGQRIRVDGSTGRVTLLNPR